MKMKKVYITLLSLLLLDVKGMEVDSQPRGLPVAHSTAQITHDIRATLESYNPQHCDERSVYPHLSIRRKQLLDANAGNEVERYLRIGGFYYSDEDWATAAAWFAKAALLNSGEAFYQLAKLRLTSDQDDKIAQVFMLIAADKGCYPAKVYLGQVIESY